MKKKTDDKIAVSILWETKGLYRALNQCSFDKGFYSPENKKASKEIIDTVIMPKKGRLNKLEKAEEYSDNFINARNKHSAVESAINGLNHRANMWRSYLFSLIYMIRNGSCFSFVTFGSSTFLFFQNSISFVNFYS